MKIKLNEIVINASPKIEGDVVVEKSIFSQLQEIKFPIKVSYRLKRLFDKLDPELKVYNEKRMELFKEYGTLDEEKQTYSVNPENADKFQKKVLELLDVEIDVEFEKIKIDEVSDVSIEPKLLVNFIFE